MKVNKINGIGFGNSQPIKPETTENKPEVKDNSNPGFKQLDKDIVEINVEKQQGPVDDIKHMTIEDPITKMQKEKKKKQISFLNLINTPQKYSK